MGRPTAGAVAKSVLTKSPYESPSAEELPLDEGGNFSGKIGTLGPSGPPIE